MSENSKRSKKETPSSSSKGKAQTSNSTSPAPMTANQYAMDFGFTPVAKSKASKSSSIQLLSSIGSYIPQGPSPFIIRPPTGQVAQLRPPVSSSSQGSSIPSSSSSRPLTFKQAVQPEPRFVPRQEIKTYFQKANVLVESIIEPEFQCPDFKETLSKIYPKSFNFIPDDLRKTRIFYEFILVDTKSVEITHVPDKSNPSKIMYSKFRIKKVINPSHWNQSLYTEKTLSKPFRPQGYTYNDYINAWYNCMWFSNYHHSWFIQFCKNAHKTTFPLWFIKWWTTFGLTNDILPVPIQESYFYFCHHIQKNQFHNSMRFCLYFQIPWIFCWDFSTIAHPQYHSITKVLKIKWWEKI